MGRKGQAPVLGLLEHATRRARSSEPLILERSMSDAHHTHRTFPQSEAAARDARVEDARVEDAQREDAQREDAQLEDAQLELLARAAIAARELCDVLWEALRAQLEQAPGADAQEPGAARIERSAELAERLADVAGTVALLARDAPAAAAATGLPAAPRRTRVVPAAPARREPVRAAPARPDPASSGARSEAARAVMLTDERDLTPASERGAQARAPWLDLIDRALARFERDRLPFALLLLQAPGSEQPTGTIHEELSPQTRAIERALAQALEPIGGRPAASPLALEPPDRYWLLVPGCDRLDARELVARLLEAAEPDEPPPDAADAAEQYFAALSRHTSPLRARVTARARLAVGTAVCPQNGQDAATLASHANIELAALRCAGAQAAPAAGPT